MKRLTVSDPKHTRTYPVEDELYGKLGEMAEATTKKAGRHISDAIIINHLIRRANIKTIAREIAVESKS